jgi:hypothetical protein
MNPKRAYAVENYEKNCVALVKPDTKIQSVCFDIKKVKIRAPKEFEKLKIPDFSFRVIANNFFLNKTSNCEIKVTGKEFLEVSSGHTNPEFKYWLVILVACIVIMAVCVYWLYKKYQTTKEEVFTIDSSMLSVWRED